MQYDHRQVTLLLWAEAPAAGPPPRLLLDVEPQQPGEQEMAAARRWLERVLAAYPRAFDVLLDDALDATARFVNFLLARGERALIVLQDERRHFYQDVAGLWRSVAAQPGAYRWRHCQWWDNEGWLSWPQLGQPWRVVRSVETWQLRWQLDAQPRQQCSDSAWLRTLSSQQLPTAGGCGWGSSAGISKTRDATSWSTAGLPITLTNTNPEPSKTFS